MNENNKNNNKAKFTEGNIPKTILKSSVPMLFGMLAAMSFNLVDTYFISRLGTIELAAISFTFPITYIFSAIAMGIGNGASALVSKAIGSGNREKVIRLSSDGVMMSLILATVMLIIGFLFFTPLFNFLGANEETMPLIKEYMYIWYPGAIFLVIPMVGNMVTRATGDMKTPSIVMMVAVLVNAILDPIFIFGWGPIPRMEMAGAAIATFIAHLFTFFFAIWILFYRDKMLSFKFPDFKKVKESWKEISYIGFPTAFTNLIVPFAFTFLISLVATYGQEAVAAFGVATRVEMFTFTVIIAIASVLGPFIGQNLGAGEFERVNKAIKFTFSFVLIWCFVVAILLAIFSENIGKIFNREPQVIEIVNYYLWLVPFTHGVLSILFLTTVTFNVFNKPFYAASLSLIRMLLIYIPLAYLGSNYFGYKGIFIAGAIANIVGGFIAWKWLYSFLGNNVIFKISDDDEVPNEDISEPISKPLKVT